MAALRQTRKLPIAKMSYCLAPKGAIAQSPLRFSAVHSSRYTIGQSYSTGSFASPWRELISPATTVDSRRSGSPAKVAGQNYDQGGRKRKAETALTNQEPPSVRDLICSILKDTNSAGSSANFRRPTNRPVIGYAPEAQQWERREHRVRPPGERHLIVARNPSLRWHECARADVVSDFS
jgi:hypothetical protein